MRTRTTRPGLAILIAALLILAIKAFVVDAAVVDGSSMLPTFAQGSLVIVLRCAYGLRWPWGGGRYLFRWPGANGVPRRGDVVVARNPKDGLGVVKRVAAVGPVQLDVAAGRLVGPALDAAISQDQASRLASGLYLPPLQLFLLGDNPPESIDSRDYGPVSADAVAGRVLMFAGKERP